MLDVLPQWGKVKVIKKMPVATWSLRYGGGISLWEGGKLPSLFEGFVCQRQHFLAGALVKRIHRWMFF